MKQSIKQFLKPTIAKIILSVILWYILFNLLLYSVSEAHCINPPCKNALIVKIGIILNIIPVIPFYFLSLIGAFELPFLFELLLIILIYFIIPVGWYYFLSCMAMWIFWRFKKKYREGNKSSDLLDK